MATQQQLEAWLAEAEQARHELMLGDKAVSISSGSGKSLSFAATDLGKLDLYIASLRLRLGLDPGLGAPLVPLF